MYLHFEDTFDLRQTLKTSFRAWLEISWSVYRRGIRHGLSGPQWRCLLEAGFVYSLMYLHFEDTFDRGVFTQMRCAYLRDDFSSAKEAYFAVCPKANKKHADAEMAEKHP